MTFYWENLDAAFKRKREEDEARIRAGIAAILIEQSKRDVLLPDRRKALEENK